MRRWGVLVGLLVACGGGSNGDVDSGVVDGGVDGSFDEDGDVGGSGVIHAEWSLIERLASDPPADNPIACASAGVATIAVHALATADDCDPTLPGSECVDLFDCADLGGTTLEMPAGDYAVWIDALDSSDNLIARSFSQTTVVSDGGQASLSFIFAVDVGNFELTWTLVDDTTNAPITCAEAGAGAVSVLATPVLNQSTFTDNIFDCADGGGMAIDNQLGASTVVVSILDQNDVELGQSAPRNETLSFGNEVVDLGNFEFAFQ